MQQTEEGLCSLSMTDTIIVLHISYLEFVYEARLCAEIESSHKEKQFLLHRMPAVCQAHCKQVLLANVNIHVTLVLHMKTLRPRGLI